MKYIDNEEKELISSYENEEWQSVKNFEEEKSKYQEYARSALKKDERINIRLSKNDLMGIKKRAVIEGIPYQTLITSIIHKYVSGRLHE